MPESGLVPYRGYFIDNRFLRAPGRGPATGHARCSSTSPWDLTSVMDFTEFPALVPRAFDGARRAFETWSRLDFCERERAVRRLEREFQLEKVGLAKIIHREMGKSLAEAEAEVDAALAKFEISREYAREVHARERSFAHAEETARFTYEPLGVMFIPGPFNFPLHIPNGHWIPALLAGNTVVFKPSEITPAVGQAIAECVERADLPAGVFQMVQGGAEVAAMALEAPELAGVLFTGSYATGVAIRRALVERTGVMTALEMGGNNPAIVCADANLFVAADEIFKGVTLTSGQRCTATRRAFVVDDRSNTGGRYEEFIARLAEQFSGATLAPLATENAKKSFELLEREIGRHKLKILARGVLPENAKGYFVPPLLVEIAAQHRQLEMLQREWFLPVLFIESVRTLDEAIDGANATPYGLAAAVFSKNRAEYEACRARVRAGVINWNRSTVGASSRLPFGGVGYSGNHRPAGSASYDYCVRPLSSLEREL